MRIAERRTAVLAAGALVSLAAAAKPLCDGERAGLRFLDFVTAPMSAADEKDWWDVGGRQFGLFSRRYHIAFAGYAAARDDAIRGGAPVGYPP